MSVALAARLAVLALAGTAVIVPAVVHADSTQTAPVPSSVSAGAAAVGATSVSVAGLTLEEGSAVREDNSFAVYQIIGGAKIYIPSMTDFTALGYTREQIVVTPAGALAGVPDAPADDTLLRERESYEIYVMTEGSRHWIDSMATLEDAGYAEGSTRVVANGALGSLPRGEDVTQETLDPPIDAVGTLARAAAAPPATASAKRKKRLIVYYRARTDCTIYPNYPKPGVVGNESRIWSVPAGRRIKWRYNVNSEWAAVSDPARSEADQFAWWGFTRKSCIGASIKQSGYPEGVPVPSRILEGRSAVRASGWRSVDFSVTPASVVAGGRSQKVNANATLRDPADFFIGNVYDGWHVDRTAQYDSKRVWVVVYSPQAKRWGYVQRSKF